MRGIEKVYEDLDGIRHRVSRLKSLNYITPELADILMPEILGLLQQVKDYIEELDARTKTATTSR